MRTRIAAIAAIALGALAFTAAPSAANEVAPGAKAAGSSAVVADVSGFETTQGRRGGGRGIGRGGRGPVVVVGPRRRNNFGRNVAIGVGAAVIGGIIASEAARANSRSGNSCGRWDYQCRRGSGWACRQLDRYC